MFAIEFQYIWFVVFLRCSVLFFLHRYNTCSPMILIGLIDSFTDYWSNINATDSVERYRSMSATCWSRWHLLVCTSKYSYISIKQKLKAFQKIVFLVFIHNLSTHFIRVWGKLYFFFIFTFFFCILHTNLYLWYSTKFFSFFTFILDPLSKNSATLQCFSLE